MKNIYAEKIYVWVHCFRVRRGMCGYVEVSSGRVKVQRAKTECKRISQSIIKAVKLEAGNSTSSRSIPIHAVDPFQPT